MTASDTPPDDEREDKRDLETILRQDLGMLEWQIRDLMPVIESWRDRYTNARVAALVDEVIGEDEPELRPLGGDSLPGQQQRNGWTTNRNKLRQKQRATAKQLLQPAQPKDAKR
jgi:hypothetical protein